jgi:hypothetical protein
VSAWNSYPNPGATDVDNLDWHVERHKLTANQLRAFKKHSNFRANAIESVIAGGGNWQPEWWETELTEEQAVDSTQFFQVLEYWGIASGRELEEDLGLDIDKDLIEQDDIQVNIWISGHQILRVILNPFKPSRIPYNFAPYEEDAYNFFGVSLPENMEDSQTLMNGFTRMAVDNAVLSGNLVFEINEDALQPGQSLEMYPGKVFVRHAGAPGQAIFGTKYPNTTQENMLMFDKFRQLADEATGIPSFSHGQTGVSGVGRTASGISMLMGAASLSIRTVVKNLDEFLLKPLGEAMYHFNMNFADDALIKGDFEVKANGTTNLLQKEIKTQRLLQFLQIVGSTPAIAITDLTYLVEEIAKGLDIDPERAILDPRLAEVQAKLLAQVQGTPQGAQAPGAQGAGAGIADETGGGGGNIAPGVPQAPGSEQFTGNLSPAETQGG